MEKVANGVSVTFDEARRLAGEATGFDPAPYGWENDDVYRVTFLWGDGGPPYDNPATLVDKATGQVRRIAGLMGHEPAVGLRPIGPWPPELADDL